MSKVAIWLDAEDKIHTTGNSDEVKEAVLRRLVHEGSGRTEANQACVDFFRDSCGIWR